MTLPCSVCGGSPCREECFGPSHDHVERHCEDRDIQGYARAFVDYRGRSGNFDALARSRAVDLFGPGTDSESAALRAAFKRLCRRYAGRTVAP